MSPQIVALLHLEFQQRRWQFGICLLWMVVVAGFAIATSWYSGLRAPVASFHAGVMLFGLVVPLFIAMKTSLGDVTDQSRSFSVALPVPLRSQSGVRLLGGWLVVIIPILIGAALLGSALMLEIVQQAGLRPSNSLTGWDLMQRPVMSPLLAVNLLVAVTALALATASMFYLLIALLGTWHTSEPRLGFTGAVVAVGWFILSGAAVQLPQSGYEYSFVLQACFPQSMLVNYSYGSEQGGSFGDLVFSGPIYGALLANLLMQIGLAAWFVLRFSAVRIGTPRVRQRWPQIKWSLGIGKRLVTACPTRAGALGWLAVRQALPMCIPGLLLALLIAPLQMNSWDESPLLYRLSDALPSSMWFIAMIWATVVGAGMFAPEINVRLDSFWRTLPIPAAKLFVLKFVVGLAVVLGVLDGTTIALGWFSPNWGNHDAMNWPYIICLVPFHTLMYSMAVAWTCVLKSAAKGGVITLISFMAVTICATWLPAGRQWDLIQVYNQLARATDPQDLAAGIYLLPVALHLVLVLLFAAIGCWALINHPPHVPAK